MWYFTCILDVYMCMSTFAFSSTTLFLSIKNTTHLPHMLSYVWTLISSLSLSLDIATRDVLINDNYFFLAQMIWGCRVSSDDQMLSALACGIHIIVDKKWEICISFLVPISCPSLPFVCLFVFYSFILIIIERLIHMYSYGLV